MPISRYLLFGLTLLLTGACAHPPKSRFSGLKNGIPKYEVLEQVGSPTRTEYINGRYIWTYKFMEADVAQTKEIHIVEDTLVYFGDPWPAGLRKALKIQNGFLKTQVLDSLGFPAKTRKEGKIDIWTFEVIDGDRHFLQEFHFEREKLLKSTEPQLKGSASESETPSKAPHPEPEFKPVE